MKQLERFYTCLALIIGAYPAWSGQVSVVNPSAGSGVAIVSPPAPAPPIPSSPAPAPTVSTTVTPTPGTTSVDVLPTAPAVTSDVISTISAGGTVDTPVMEISNTPIGINLSSEPQTLIGQVFDVFAPTSPSNNASSGNGSKVGSAQQSSAPSTVSQFLPQISGAVQGINVSAFTPQQVATLVATIDAQLGQAGLSPAARQVLTTERARLGGVADRQ